MRASIAFVKTALSELNANPNRALGQNFCIDGERLSSCVDAMTLAKNVIEIGPGLGALTELLLEKTLRSPRSKRTKRWRRIFKNRSPTRILR